MKFVLRLQQVKHFSMRDIYFK